MERLLKIFCCFGFCSAGSLNGLKGDPFFLLITWLSKYAPRLNGIKTWGGGTVNHSRKTKTKTRELAKGVPLE